MCKQLKKTRRRISSYNFLPCNFCLSFRSARLLSNQKLKEKKCSLQFCNELVHGIFPTSSHSEKYERKALGKSKSIQNEKPEENFFKQIT